MNLKIAIPLAVAVVLGLVAAILAHKIVNSQPKQVDVTGVTLVDVVVASRDLQPGDALTAAVLGRAKVEPKAAAQGSYTDVASLEGRVTTVPARAGQVMVENMLAPVGARAGLQGIIRDGFRAITIEVNEFTGLGSFLQPGNRIDLLGRVPSTSGQGQMAITIVQNVEILAVNERLTPPGEARPGDPPPMPTRSVTLLVTPEQAQKIDLATTSGQPRLVLRAVNDRDTTSARGVTMEQLRGGFAMTAPVGPTPPLAAGTTSNPESSETGKSTSLTSNPADDIFTELPERRPPFRAPPPRTLSIIRGGVESQVQIETNNPNAKVVGVGDLLQTSPR